jgi:DNA-binding NtrC family response regulator
MENDPRLRESLPALLREQIPDIIMQKCPSVYAAIEQLPLSRFDLVIFNVRLAGLGNFFLQQKHQMLHPYTPFIVTAGAEDYQLARRARNNGAFDIITAPLIPRDAISTVRVACKLRSLRLSKDRLSSELKLLMDLLPNENNVPIAATLRKTTTPEERYASQKAKLQAYERTIEALEKSLDLLRLRMDEQEYQVGQGVERRLSMLADPTHLQ